MSRKILKKFSAYAILKKPQKMGSNFKIKARLILFLDYKKVLCFFHFSVMMFLAIQKNFSLNAVGIWKLNNPTWKVQNFFPNFLISYRLSWLFCSRTSSRRAAATFSWFWFWFRALLAARRCWPRDRAFRRGIFWKISKTSWS